jgi:hypothetical protein
MIPTGDGYIDIHAARIDDANARSRNDASDARRTAATSREIVEQ